ncbi:MAG: phosphonoacetaldehyde reductase, partial [Desulfobacterales bacterium]|nr:phosphonoacetaldehyde reductase [Desulfobacterales bacterium]
MKQRIDSGFGCAGELSRILERGGYGRIFLVTGKASYTQSGAERVVNHCLGDREWIRFSDFSVNPSLEDAMAGIALFRAFQPDLVVAVGGGSVMDMAKLIKTLAPHRDEDFESLIKTSAVTEAVSPMVALPTTSGTGSESTHFAVAYVKKRKFSLAHESLLPEFAVLDPDLTRSASPAQRAASGMDALCQAVESHWNRSATQESRAYAERAISAILPALETAVNHPDDASLASMLMGANMAGRAINITKTTAPHALSYTLTTHHGLPHGHAVALVLGRFFSINAQLMAEAGGGHMETLHGLLGGKDARECEALWYGLMERIGLETDMEKTGILAPGCPDRIVDNVNLERLK